MSIFADMETSLPSSAPLLQKGLEAGSPSKGVPTGDSRAGLDSTKGIQGVAPAYRSMVLLAGRLGRMRGTALVSATPLPAGGSSRKYCLMEYSDGFRALAAEGSDTDENRAFIGFSHLFRAHGLQVPEVYLESEDGKVYLQQYVADRDLFSIRDTPFGKKAIEDALDMLPAFQTIPEGEWENIPFNPPFRGGEVLKDLHYFRERFLGPLEVGFDADALEGEFEAICRAVCDVDPGAVGLMLRDFQSRNVMVGPEPDLKPWLIDFQGARRGPALYDAISFLFQARAGFRPHFRREMLERYAAHYTALRQDVDARALLAAAPYIILLRLLQTLGAYGLRGLTEGKAHFLRSIPAAVANLAELLEDPVRLGSPMGWPDEGRRLWPELGRLARLLTTRFPADEHTVTEPEPQVTTGERPALTVTVSSFSYGKGYPEDLSGNGGGFAFDCRALPNPGRLERFKALNGRNPAVRAYLEERGEVAAFLDSCFRLVGSSVRRYLERGFTSLQVGFGCTGGQHRSVYCAESMAIRLAGSFPEIRVRLLHREQGLEEWVLPPKAMIPAAGLGTRLRPWTLEHPKALVPVDLPAMPKSSGGKEGEEKGARLPLLELQLRKMELEGFGRVGVNVHHFADQILDFMAKRDSKKGEPGKASVVISDESGELLETGGGIVAMASLLDPEGDGFLVHNADILSNADLGKLWAGHRYGEADITLLVSRRKSSRGLLVEADGRLAGWENRLTGETRQAAARTGERTESLAFSGIYVVGPGAIADMRRLYGNRPFPLMDYLLHPDCRARVRCVVQPGLRLLDIGKPDALAKAPAFLKEISEGMQ